MSKKQIYKLKPFKNDLHSNYYYVIIIITVMEINEVAEKIFLKEAQADCSIQLGLDEGDFEYIFEVLLNMYLTGFITKHGEINKLDTFEVDQLLSLRQYFKSFGFDMSVDCYDRKNTDIEIPESLDKEHYCRIGMNDAENWIHFDKESINKALRDMGIDEDNKDDKDDKDENNEKTDTKEEQPKKINPNDVYILIYNSSNSSLKESRNKLNDFYAILKKKGKIFKISFSFYYGNTTGQQNAVNEQLVSDA